MERGLLSPRKVWDAQKQGSGPGADETQLSRHCDYDYDCESRKLLTKHWFHSFKNKLFQFADVPRPGTLKHASYAFALLSATLSSR